MKQRPRIYYSASQGTIIWNRWRQGDAIHQIAGLFDRFHSSIHRILAETGGIRPVTRQRSKSALTPAEREEISRPSSREARSGRLRYRSLGRPLRSAASFVAMVVREAIEPVAPIKRPGIAPIAPSSVNWCKTAH